VNRTEKRKASKGKWRGAPKRGMESKPLLAKGTGEKTSRGGIRRFEKNQERK